MSNIYACNAPRAYLNALELIRMVGKYENSRAGDVLSVSDPVLLEVYAPKERVLFDPVRDANPFFHLMEAIWMLAGENEVKWLLQFNKGFGQYAERDGIMRGAYGFRWRYHFHIDQILAVVRTLQKDPNSRRAVLAMWDPAIDNDAGHSDYPCNTHLYFRVVEGQLSMTVCNRSNDLVWGMCGSNIVHMTMLQEVVADALKLSVGHYYVMTNNLHIYKSLPNFEKILGTTVRYDKYNEVNPFRSILGTQPLEKFLADCTAFVGGWFSDIKNDFLRHVALPMYQAWQARRAKLTLVEVFNEFKPMPPDNDWRKAAEEWIMRRETSSSSTSTERLPWTSLVQNDISEGLKASSGLSTLPPAVTTSPTTPSSSSSDSSSTAGSESISSPDDSTLF